MSLAALERARLLSRATTSEERRQYVDHLLTLPAYKDSELTTYFAESIPTHFAELEDLQDQSVDAVLDLCEDEDERARPRQPESTETRICGIKALAIIGKTEPRWVRGNTGVLLQLLESPPTEVRHVRQALYDLMDVSAQDVFGQMAEDCRGSEEETGASRRKILDFLQGSTSKRAEILESGRNVEAEKAFAEGFYDVMQTTAFAEKRQILALLLPLSTISGRTATPASTGRYAKTLTRCLKHGSSVALTTPLIRLWAELVKRNTNIDPRWTIYFLADHGAAVVSLLAEKQDKQAQEVLLAPTGDTRRLSRCMEEKSDRDLGAKDLVPDFIETMLKAAQRIISGADRVTALEMTLYSVYTVVIINRSTRDAVGSGSARAAKEISEFADKQKRATSAEKQIQQWRNIRDMADTLADRGLKPVPITPTWTLTATVLKPEQAVEVITGAVKSSAEIPVAPASRPNGKVALAPVASHTTPTPAKSELPIGLTSTPAVQRSSASEPIRPESIPTIAAAGLSIRSAASKIPTPPPTASTATTPGPSLSIRSAASKPHAVSPTPPVEPPSAGLSIKSAATHSRTPAGSSPAPSDGFKIRSAQPAPKPSGLSIRSAAATATMTAGHSSAPSASEGLSIRSAQSPSLLSRLGSSNGNGTAKRPREESVTAESAMDPPSRPTSLLDRLAASATPEGESSKRPRPNLLSRMSSTSGTTTQSAPVTPALPELTFKRTASTTNAAPEPGGFSIKNRAAAGPELIVRRAVSDSVAPPEEESGVIRKGRGFRQASDGGQDDDVIMTPPQTATAPAATSWGKTGLGARFQNQKRREWL